MSTQITPGSMTGRPDSKRVAVKIRIYHSAPNYAAYQTARFDRSNTYNYGFMFEGHMWAYEVTAFDDDGRYDVLYRFVNEPEAPETAEIVDQDTSVKVLVALANVPQPKKDASPGFEEIEAHGWNACVKELTSKALATNVTLQKYVWYIPRNGGWTEPNEEWYVYLGDFRLKAFKRRDYKFPERAARSYVTALCQVLGVSFKESTYKPKPRQLKGKE